MGEEYGWLATAMQAREVCTMGPESPGPFILPWGSTTYLCVPANSSGVWHKPQRWTGSCWTRPYERYRPTQRPSFLHQLMTRSPFAIPRCPHNTQTGRVRDVFAKELSKIRDEMGFQLIWYVVM